MTASEYSFDAPDEVAAGPVEIRLDNVGGTQHNAQLARISANELDDLDEGNVGGVVDNATMLGGPATIEPGQTGPAVGAVLDPGTYVFLCFFTTTEGQPHAELGMMEAFTVTGEPVADPAEAPSGDDGTFTLDDFGIEVPDGFDGSGSFTVEAAEGYHELQVISVPDGTQPDEVETFLADRCRTTDCTSQGGLSSLRFRKQGTLDLDLESGSYVFACFVPGYGGDGAPAGGAPPHWQSGMWELVEVA